MRVIIEAVAPSVYQLTSLLAFGMPRRSIGNGAYACTMEFNNMEEARQYLRGRAEKYNDADPCGSSERLAGMIADINNNSLRLDAVTAYIRKKVS